MKYAKNYAFQSALNGEFLADQLSYANSYGKNSMWSTYPMTCDEIVNFWYKGGNFYNYNSPYFNQDTGSFTQVMILIKLIMYIIHCIIKITITNINYLDYLEEFDENSLFSTN